MNSKRWTTKKEIHDDAHCFHRWDVIDKLRLEKIGRRHAINQDCVDEKLYRDSKNV